jgi:hypothetical protein
MIKPTLLVRLNHSENRSINASPLCDGGFHPIEEVNKLFWPVDFKNKNSDRGYDKTGFTLLVWDGSDDDLSEYDGRIDLGDGYSSHNILQEHVKLHCQYTIENKDRLPFGGTGEEAEKHIKALNWWLKVVA